MRLDFRKRVRFVALASSEADRVLGHLDPEIRYTSSHLLKPDGTLESGGASALSLGKLLPLTAPFAWLFCCLPYHRQIAERLYRWVADNRHRFDPESSCGLERPPELQ